MSSMNTIFRHIPIDNGPRCNDSVVSEGHTREIT
ncbi:hypothetical protein DFP94_1011241 [Fontibacillus phaseoli]|uniref:Uncharacterized protein n=1 Tax=Fontibacillus phaseoli TaxID=1416533 RepID=A0A369BPT6_9BACL|nr:hypothetical protein DFP94_1011241 [Fontibacillus phaseoli]